MVALGPTEVEAPQQDFEGPAHLLLEQEGDVEVEPSLGVGPGEEAFAGVEGDHDQAVPVVGGE